jgi:pentatricopeptide repeat protein
VHMYTAVIDACAKAQQWQPAVALLREMQCDSSISTVANTAATSSPSITGTATTPNEHSYTAAIQVVTIIIVYDVDKQSNFIL